MPAIRFEQVCKSYGGVHALSDVTLGVEGERLTVLTGPPRGGKSVLLRLLVGLEAPEAGRILLDGADITQLPAARRTIGYVPQSFALFPHMSVRDNIAYPLALQKVPRAQIERRIGQAADILRIGPLLAKRPSELSGGEKQRAAIARGLLKDAAIFILDDPLVGLDFKLRESLMEDLTEMRAQLGATFFYATSDPLEALTMAEDLVVLDQGRVMESGAIDAVYHAPRSLRAAELVGFPRCNVIPGRLDGAMCDTALLRFPVTLDVPAAGEVAVAIRAEHIVFLADDAAVPHRARGAGTVRLLENLGAESVIHFSAGDGTLVTTAPSPDVAHLDLGDSFGFALRPEGMLVFDRATGRRIGRGCARNPGVAHA